VRRGTIAPVTSGPPEAQHLLDLKRLRRVRDRIDREYAEPLDVEALARGANMSAGHLSRQFRLAFGESPYSYLMTRRIERAMALLRRGDLSVTDACFEVGCSSLGTFSTRFTELVGVPPSVYRRERRQAADATAGMPSCVAKQVTRPIRNREAPAADPCLEGPPWTSPFTPASSRRRPRSRRRCGGRHRLLRGHRRGAAEERHPHRPPSRRPGRVVSIDQGTIRGSRRSNPATYTGLLDPIRTAFAKANGVKPALFSANSEGACPICNGAGVIYTDLAMMAGVATLCEECEGKRFQASVLEYEFGGRDISEVLAMSVTEAQEFFSTGEARTPAAAAILDRLVDSGKSVIVIEHHQAVMAHADRPPTSRRRSPPRGGARIEDDRSRDG
jgi:AraC-like DNA-binding protein